MKTTQELIQELKAKIPCGNAIIYYENYARDPDGGDDVELNEANFPGWQRQPELKIGNTMYIVFRHVESNKFFAMTGEYNSWDSGCWDNEWFLAEPYQYQETRYQRVI